MSRLSSSCLPALSTAAGTFYRDFLANRIPLAAAAVSPLSAAAADPTRTTAAAGHEAAATAARQTAARQTAAHQTAAAECGIRAAAWGGGEGLGSCKRRSNRRRQHALLFEEEGSSNATAAGETAAARRAAAGEAAAGEAAAGEAAAAAARRVGEENGRFFSYAEQLRRVEDVSAHRRFSSSYGSSSSTSSDSERSRMWGTVSDICFSLGRNVLQRSERLLRRSELALHAAIRAISRPTEDLHFALLSEVTSDRALAAMQQQMLGHGDGRRVLREKPLLDSRSLDVALLRSLPPETVGGAYMRFMDANALHAGVRPPVRLVECAELSYVLTRYRQLHDFMHVAYGVGISVEAEVALKLIEFLQTGLPATLLAAVFGPLAAPVIRARLPAGCSYPQYTSIQSGVLQVDTYPSVLSSSFSPSLSRSASSLSSSSSRANDSLPQQQQQQQQLQQQQQEERRLERQREESASVGVTLNEGTYQEEEEEEEEEERERRDVLLLLSRDPQQRMQEIHAREAGIASQRVEEENNMKEGSISWKEGISTGSMHYDDAHKMFSQERDQQFVEELNKKEILYPRHALITELLPWALRAGRHVRHPLHCVYVEEWLHAPLEAFRRHCGVLLPPLHLEPYWR